MKRKRRYQSGLSRSSAVKWCILIALVLCFGGISYAAHTNVLFGDFSFGTSNMSYIFNKTGGHKVVVQLQNGTESSEKDLNATVNYDNKKLIITNIGPLDILEDLNQGDAIIKIKYTIKMEKKDDGLKLPATVETARDQGYDLGTVEFKKMNKTPVWRVENSNESWGTSSGLDTPDIVNKYLPNILGEFHVYNTLLPDIKEGVMVGTLLLKQESKPDLPQSKKIGLSSLSLPTEIINEIKSSTPKSTIEISGTYGFTIPLNLDQFNIEE